MSRKLDLNDIAKFEQAIANKYGKEAIENPRKYWNDEKEKDYLNQIKEVYEKELIQDEKNDKIEQDGFLVSKKLFNKETTKRICPVCEVYSFKIKDDVFMNKFDCCYNCYIKWIEGGREERWLSGWRPTKS